VSTGRLLVVSDTLVGGQGGAAARHADWFARRGWDVAVAAPEGEPNGRRVAVHFPVAIPKSVREVGAMRAAARRLAAIRSEYRAGVVHCHGARSFAAVRAAGGRPPFVTLHLIAAVTSDPRGYSAVRRLGLAAIPPIAAGAFSAVPDPPRGWVFTPHASDRLARQPPSGSPGSPTPLFLWVGRLDEPKRPDVFVDALARLASSRPDARGVMVGDGPLAAETRERVRRSGAPVEMIGFTADTAGLMEEAWAVVLFSAAEALTFVVQEAMWSGRAVVASPLAGIRYLLGPGGRVASDAEHAAKELACLCDRHLAIEEGAAAAVRIRGLLDPDDPWPAIEKRYASLDGAGRSVWARARRRNRRFEG
jgi:glycosyltransferase involved in cell wall biosynthesis